MKIALIGAGRTGSLVLERRGRHEILGPYSRSRPPSVADLRRADAVVLFVPGPALPSLLPLLLEAAVPVASGSTGYAFTEADKSAILARGIPWVQAANFSLGMNLMLELARAVGSYRPAREAGALSLREVHHVRKLDAPSGSALALARATGLRVPIESVREGDVVGLHSLRLELPGETLTLTHDALDRRVFAEGALWAAQHLPGVPPGFHLFEDLVRKTFFEGNTL